MAVIRRRPCPASAGSARPEAYVSDRRTSPPRRLGGHLDGLAPSCPRQLLSLCAATALIVATSHCAAHVTSSVAQERVGLLLIAATSLVMAGRAPSAGKRGAAPSNDSHIGLALILAMALMVAPSCATRSPSHDASFGGSSQSSAARKQQAAAFSSLPTPLAGLDRLGRQSCISKYGAAACRNPQQVGFTRVPGAQPDMQYLQRGHAHQSAGAHHAHPHPRSASRRDNRKRTPSIRSRTSMSASGTSMAKAPRPEYELVADDKKWESDQGHTVVYERMVEMREMPGGGGGGGGGEDGPAGHVGLVPDRPRLMKWHVMGSPQCNFSSVVVFPFDSRSKTCTLIQEYCPGTNSILSGIPAGSFEPSKHEDLLQAAIQELNEEAGLKSGRFIALAPNGIPADKYSRNRLHPFLAIDCLFDENPLPQDDTEHITVEHGVPLSEAVARLLAGDMPAPAAMTTLLAMEKLRQMGLAD